jgi:hypothetical protein
MRLWKRAFILSVVSLSLPTIAYPQDEPDDKGSRTSVIQRWSNAAWTRRNFSDSPSPKLFQDDEASTKKSGFGFVVGYTFIDIDDHTFHHNTHPDDAFLPRANEPGSAGTTILKTTHWALVGAGYQQKLSRWSLTFDSGLLVGIDPDRRPGHSDHRKKNENDSRPDAQAAFIYSKPTLGLRNAVGFTYDFKEVSFGLAGQLSVVKIESGWDRFGEDQKESSDTQTIPTIGPKVGVWLGPRARVEGSVQIGRAVSFAVALRFAF